MKQEKKNCKEVVELGSFETTDIRKRGKENNHSLVLSIQKCATYTHVNMEQAACVYVCM